MSPALLDTGALIQNPNPNGQISLPLLSSFIASCLNSVSQSEKPGLRSFPNSMNPSTFGDLNSGFSNSSGNGQNLSFNSPSIQQSSGKPLSRQRFVKVRRQSNPQNLKSTAETWAAPGFNPFRPVSGPAEQDVSRSSEFGLVGGGNEAYVLGASRTHLDGNLDSRKWNVENEVTEQMKNVGIGSGNVFLNDNLNASNKRDFVFGSDHSKSSTIDDNLKKLTIDGNEIAKVLDEKSKLTENNISKFGLTSGDNVGTSIGKSMESSIPDELMSKLNLKEAGDINDISSAYDAKKSGFKTGAKVRDAFGESLENALPDMISNLNIKVSMDANVADNKTHAKDSSAAETMEGTRSYAGGKRESILLSEMKQKLNIGNAVEESSGQTDKAFSSSGLAGGYTFGLPPMDGVEKREGFIFMSKQDGAKSPFVEFKTPNSKGNLFSGLNQKVEISAKFKDSKVKKKKGKLKQPTKVHLWPGENFISRESSSREILEASDSYSPMDVSPYQETLSDTQYSRETSVASEESFSLDNQCPSTDSQPTVLNDAIDEDLIVATQQMDINEEVLTFEEIKEEGSDYCSDKCIGSENPPEGSISGAETESFRSANEEIDCINDFAVTSAENDASLSTNIERQNSDVRFQFGSPACSEDMVGSGFTFAAASSSPASPRHYPKKKSWAKVGHDIYYSSPTAKAPCESASSQFYPFSSASLPVSSLHGKEAGLSSPKDNSEELVGQEIKQESILISAASIAAQEACEKWRLRGNQAYAHGGMSKAEDCYTQGINCISKSETSRSTLRALMLCFSNRAATHMSLGRMRDALRDCEMAAEIDPNFLRVQVRAANCHLALGEVEDASQYFKKCLQLGSDICVDRKIAVEGSEGLQKAQKVSECLQQSAELLETKTSNDAGSALELISEGLSISRYAEKLIEMKAASLFLLQKYEEVIELCEQTFDSAKKNSPLISAEYQSADLDSTELTRNYSFCLWRCCLILKSYFYLGKLEEAIGSLEKQEELIAKSGLFRNDKKMDALTSLAASIRELLRHKVAGNEAFQAGKHSEAIEHYTAALSLNVESRPFAAICFCHRAAAYKALGHTTDAIADCSLAIALDRNYLKAISRRATLYEMIRDYGQAASDLQRLIAALAKQVEDKTNQIGSSDRLGNLASDLRQARMHLSTVEEEARKEIPLDMYLILGVEPSATASEIKKAYRKAALRHHPDKAGQSLTRSENGDDRLWKEIGEEIHKHADRLFKMIGEAYAVITDPTKRTQYDLEEEMRNVQKKHTGNSTYRTYPDAQNYQFDRSGPRRQWREVWRSYGTR